MRTGSRHLRSIPGGGEGAHAARPRHGWREFRAEHPLLFFALVAGTVAALAIDGFLLYKRNRYLEEAARMRSGMSLVERRATDAIMARNESRGQRLRLELELLRRQALTDERLHITLALDSAVMRLERDGVVLREMPVQLGPERRIGVPPDTVRMATPRGTRTVDRVLDADSVWQVPAWVYADRGIAAPSDRALRGALGPAAVVLAGGTVLYSMPSVGPLNDSAYVIPGGVRVRAEDLRAVAPNIRPGMAVYLY
jgi:hypothetical protein